VNKYGICGKNSIIITTIFVVRVA